MTVELPDFLPPKNWKAKAIEVEAVPVDSLIPESLKAVPQDRDFLNSHIQIIHVK